MKQWQETREVLEFLARARGAGQRAALATVVRVRGSAYRHEGAKLAVAADGSTAGNVSGGGLQPGVGGGGGRRPRARAAAPQGRLPRAPPGEGAGPGRGWGGARGAGGGGGGA